MLTTSFNPREEKDKLYEALAHFHREWPDGLSLTTIIRLCEAAERAEEVLATLKARASLDRDTQFQGRQLNILLLTAMLAVAAVLEEAGASGNPSPLPKGPAPTSEVFFPVGTILECPECGEGLYKVTQVASTWGLVVDEGSVLVPLNHSIPSRSAWKPFACPLCGGRLFKEGKIPTLQHGWM